MRKIFILYLILQSCYLHAQTKYEPGYFINNEGVKTVCLIRNMDWYKNPTEIRYKLDENGEAQIADIQDINEFSVNTYIFKKYTLDVDRASSTLSTLDRFPQPTFKKETLFLQLLVDGSAQLYRLRDTNLIRFFLKVGDSLAHQLVHKRYITPQNAIGQNDTYRHQLLVALKCEGINIFDTKNLAYDEKDLTRFLIKYNTCKDPNYKNIANTKKKGAINLFLKPGLNIGNAEIENEVQPTLNRQFESSIGYRIGLEIEGILPSNNNKWALLAEPSFQQINLEQKGTNSSIAEMQYTSFQIPIGARYRIYLNQKSVLFINGLYMLDFVLDSQVEFEPGNDFELSSTTGLLFGAGYIHNNRLMVELRYATTRNVFRRFISWSADYSDFGIYLGYNLIRR